MAKAVVIIITMFFLYSYVGHTQEASESSTNSKSEQELSDKLGLKVDLVTARSVNPDLRDYIQKDLVKIM